MTQDSGSWGQQGGYPPQGSGGYPPQPQQPGGYPPQQPGGYPPQQPGGFPPQQPAGFPPSNRVIPRRVGIRRNRLPADIRLSSREATGLRGPAVSRLAVPLHRARRAR